MAVVLAFLSCVLAAGAVEKPGDLLPLVYEAVTRIEDHVRKEERLQQITELMTIDSSLKSIDRKLDTLLGGGQALARAGNLDHLDTRLQTVESNVAALQYTMAQMESDLKQFREAERQRADDLDQKMRKMTNVVTALYEMNKEMKKGMAGEVVAVQPANFLFENLDEMDRKVREQMSVMATEIRRDLASLRQVAVDMAGRCEAGREREEVLSRGATAEGADTLDDLLQGLGRSTREIKEELQSLGDMLAVFNTTGDCQTQEVQQARASSPIQTVLPNLVSVPDSVKTCTFTTTFTLFPRSCAELKKGGATCDGVYIIFLRSSRAVRVYCDMTTAGGGWTVILRRGDYGQKQISFNQNWNGYKEGFGDVEGEFWLGNENINAITSLDNNTVLVRLAAFDGDSLNLTYNYFAVDSEENNYRLQIGRAIGRPSAAKSTLLHHNNQPFSTYDRKNNDFDGNCASRYKGGWWFNSRCFHGFLTGEYFKPDERKDSWRGILWYDWKKNNPLKSAEMLIRPKFTS